MSWLLRHNWLWSLLAFLLGAAITWALLDRRQPVLTAPDPAPTEEKEEALVGARARQQPTAHEQVEQEPVAHKPVAREPAAQEPVFSRVMDAELTLFDHESDATQPQVQADVPPGRYGEGSADAVPHQGPPDGFTIKGNAQSMLFHTPDSPYYGRTKPEVWFRTEADAERAGFTKYARRPRKSAKPGE
jgi:hypothetical protein